MPKNDDIRIPKKKPGDKQPKIPTILLLPAIAIGFLLVQFFLQGFGANSSMIGYSEFKEKIKSGEIQEVELKSTVYLGYSRVRSEYIDESNGISSFFQPQQERDVIYTYQTIPWPYDDIVLFLEENGVVFQVAKENSGTFMMVIYFALFIGATILLFRMMSKRMGGANMMSIGQNSNRIVAERDLKTKFLDVAGCEEAKDELVEIVDFLKNPDKYTSIGGKIPKGALLVGPPGTGKTLLARAVAGEAGVTFFKMSGSDFVEMFVGVGASRVRDLFKQARTKSPCIIFIDELDAIGKSRAGNISTNDEREQTLNQLLVEMDGFDSKSGVIILAATNRPEVLDPALLRPGRFDRQVLVDKPDLVGREEILNIHAKGVKLSKDLDIKKVAKATSGLVGADLANIVNEAALHAVRNGHSRVEFEDFNEAIEKTTIGLEKKNRIIAPKAREVIAYHEVGHAIMTVFTPDSDPLHKVSIVPRGLGILGYSSSRPEEDRLLVTKQHLLREIGILLGGRASEEIFFKEVSTGAANDIQRVTDIVQNMIMKYGMSEKFQNITLSKRGGSFLNQEQMTREYSEKTQQSIDEEIVEIVAAEYKRVLAIIKKHKKLIHTIATELLDVEVMEAENFIKIVKDDDEGNKELERKNELSSKISSDAQIKSKERNDAIIERLKKDREEAKKQAAAEEKREAERKKQEQHNQIIK